MGIPFPVIPHQISVQIIRSLYFSVIKTSLGDSTDRLDHLILLFKK